MSLNQPSSVVVRHNAANEIGLILDRAQRERGLFRSRDEAIGIMTGVCAWLADQVGAQFMINTMAECMDHVVDEELARRARVNSCDPG